MSRGAEQGSESTDPAALRAELAALTARLREREAELARTRAELQDWSDALPHATLLTAGDSSIVVCNAAGRRLLGVPPDAGADWLTGRRKEPLLRELDRDFAAIGAAGQVAREVHATDGRSVRREVVPRHGGDGFVVTFRPGAATETTAWEARERAARLELGWEIVRGGVFEHQVPIDADTWVSEPWARILGYAPAELPPYAQLLEWIEARIHPDDAPAHREREARFLRGESPRHRAEIRMRHRDGRWIWVRSVSTALARDTEGRATRVICMMIDVTETKLIEAELRESETRFRTLTDELPLIVWVHDAEGRQEFVNATFCEFFGVSREEMVEARWQDLLHPDDADRYIAEFARCVRDRIPFHAETRVRARDGTWHWFESWGRPRWSDGAFRGFVGATADVTAHRHLQASLRETGERFRTLADNIAQLAWMADGDGNIEWYNRRWYEYTGTSSEEVTARGWADVHHPDHAERVARKIAHCLRAGQAWEDTFPLRGSDGAYRWFLSRALPIRDADGRVSRWFGTMTDITAQRELEERLREADRQKNEFLAVLGHELRNPLAAIRSAADVLALFAKGDERVDRVHDVIARQSAHMTRLLDGLLDVSRIIRGKIGLEREPLDLTALCQRIVRDLAERIGGRRRIRVIADGAVPWVHGDPVRITQIVDNLLTNAVHHTAETGTIDVHLSVDDADALLAVTDDGEGIAPDFLPHVFEIFRQSEQNLDRRRGGLGLGLALVRHLAELHGGAVHAHSAGRGHGSRFTVRLPGTAARPDAPAATARRSRGLAVLLVEDNPDAAAMLREALTIAGHTIAVAHDGAAALAAAARSVPDVVLCDIGLPGELSGYDVAERLRADPRTRAVPRIALSGYGRPTDRERAAASGFHAHLTKPVTTDDLERALAAVLGSGGPTDRG